MILNWKKSTKELPEPGETVIGLNEHTGLMEFGFRSTIDKHETMWLDFHFPITHWAYANEPEEI